MKKFLVTILAIVYLTVSSGATVNLHYCMGKLMSWNLSHKSEGKCGSCGMEKAGHKGCCHDEHKQLKIEKDQKASEFAFKFLITSSDTVLVSFIDLAVTYPSSSVLDNRSTHAPPRLGAVPIFVLNCNFCI
jgi:hypothetical protein